MIARRWILAAAPGALAAALLQLGCGGAERTPGGQTSNPPPGPEPIAGLRPGTWIWVPFSDSTRDDGTPTGIAVSQGTGPDLVLFLNGGGACWDYLTCYVLNLAAHGPFGEEEFQHLSSTELTGSILDRALAGNPFAEASLVFVPYCTGDGHAGDHVATYVGDGGSRVPNHAGRANIAAFLRRVAATWPSPRCLVASGGGFGAILNYDAIRGAFPSSQAFLGGSVVATP